MLALNRIGMAIKTGRSANLPDAIFGILHRCGDISDRWWHATTQHPGLMDVNRGHILEFRAPLADEQPVGGSWSMPCLIGL